MLYEIAGLTYEVRKIASAMLQIANQKHVVARSRSDF